ncbi:MAG: L,D-transpeptidase [Leptolyngbya sp. BL-A-14]
MSRLDVFPGQLLYPEPDNPLGVRWLGLWTDSKTPIAFHGTNQEELRGQAVSHGCLWMRNQDVTAMFDHVSMGTTVVVEP